MSKQIPFRYDFVGSFLRPANLKAAREDFENGKISADELKAVEDKEIERLINKRGTWILCGDLTVLHMRKQKRVYRFTAKTQ